MLKAFADRAGRLALSLDVDLVAASSSYARGNENNPHQPDGMYYLGPGTTAGYAVVNLGARYQLHRRLQLLRAGQQPVRPPLRHGRAARADGIHRRGHLHRAAVSAVGGEFPVQQATFFAPGAPRYCWIGTRLEF